MRVVERVIADADFHGGEPAPGFVAAVQCAGGSLEDRGSRIVERVADEVRGRVLLAEDLEVPLQLGLQNREGWSVSALEPGGRRRHEAQQGGDGGQGVTLHTE